MLCYICKDIVLEHIRPAGWMHKNVGDHGFDPHPSQPNDLQNYHLSLPDLVFYINFAQLKQSAQFLATIKPI